MKNRPDLSYHDGAREFGAARKHGRKHAGCDLNAPIGTEIFAVKDGKIIQKPYEFAGETFALEIDHSDFIVRYGEIQKELPPGLGVGKTVKRGQLIAYVGKFVTEEHDIKHMLHFEMYSGEESGPLSDKLNPPYQRRGDLMDPTSFLDNAILLAP
jgi:murein DD-endopeptidase MepM/ murein hydrolase activator NlpD